MCLVDFLHLTECGKSTGEGRGMSYTAFLRLTILLFENVTIATPSRGGSLLPQYIKEKSFFKKIKLMQTPHLKFGNLQYINFLFLGLKAL